MKSKQILFLGTHGQFNIGDELLLETFLELLGKEHKYYINSYQPEVTKKQLQNKYQIEIFHTTQHKWYLLKILFKIDLVIFGGGSIIKELYKSVGRNKYSTLMMLLILVTFAKQIARKPIVMSNIGVGPLETKTGKYIAKLILSQVDRISVRDNASFEICNSLKINKHRYSLAADAVFGVTSFGYIHQGHANKRRALKLALNLNFNIQNPDNWDNFLITLAASLRLLNMTQAVEIEIHALPMQSKFKKNNDYEILAAFKNKNQDLSIILHRPETVIEVAKIISECDVLVAERLHALIIAAILEKPFVALMYDLKVQELVTLFNTEEYAMDINQPFSPEALRDKILALLENQKEHIDLVKSITAILRERVKENFDSLKRLLLDT